VAKLYAQAAVCVAPSLFETFGYACLEGMIHGKAIIASPTGGIAEMLDGGRCGLLYTPPDIERLSDLLLCLLKDGGLRARLGRAARARACTHYHPDLIASAVEGFYRQAIADLA
jgi:glycogen synthase